MREISSFCAYAPQMSRQLNAVICNCKHSYQQSDDRKGYFHSTTLMLSLRIGLDVVRQKSDLDARILKDAPPDLAVFGRRFVAVAAAALPAMVAAASAVAQPELSGCRLAGPSSSPAPLRSVTADFRSAAVSSQAPLRSATGDFRSVAVSSPIPPRSATADFRSAAVPSPPSSGETTTMALGWGCGGRN